MRANLSIRWPMLVGCSPQRTGHIISDAPGLQSFVYDFSGILARLGINGLPRRRRCGSLLGLKVSLQKRQTWEGCGSCWKDGVFWTNSWKSWALISRSRYCGAEHVCVLFYRCWGYRSELDDFDLGPTGWVGIAGDTHLAASICRISCSFYEVFSAQG